MINVIKYSLLPVRFGIALILLSFILVKFVFVAVLFPAEAARTLREDSCLIKNFIIHGMDFDHPSNFNDTSHNK